MKNILAASCLLVLSLVSFSQESNHSIFDDIHVHRIDIRIEDSDYELILSRPDSSILVPVDVIITYPDASDTLKNIGFRIKGNTSRYSDKKSFKLDINEFEKGRQYQDFEKLNLNAYTNDPTHIRAHLVIKGYEKMNVPVGRSGFVELYINQQYNGLYNVNEQVDEEFTKEVFGSKKGRLFKCHSLANFNYLGDNPKNYITRRGPNLAYELKGSEDPEDYRNLMELISVINQSSNENFHNHLLSKFNLTNYIKSLAVDISTGNWDSHLYTANNFYLYENPENDKFEFIPYDFDNTFGIDWLKIDWSKKGIYNFHYRDSYYMDPDTLTGLEQQWKDFMIGIRDGVIGDTLRPLYYRVLEDTVLRDQFNYYMQEFHETYLNPENLYPEIDRLMELLEPFIEADTLDPYSWHEAHRNTYAPLDLYEDIFGIKMYYLPYGLKDFIEKSNERNKTTLEPVKRPFFLTDLRISEKEIRIEVEGEQPENIKLDWKTSKGKKRTLEMTLVNQNGKLYQYKAERPRKFNSEYILTIQANINQKEFFLLQ